jgi:beta-CASP RNase J family ribonuclease
MSAGLRILPVGGLGRIGMNGMLVGVGDRWVLVDCGVQWPDSDVIGAERQLPDLDFMARWKGKVEAIVLTHGHEDHIGALPWVWPILGEVPVYASEFTAELVRHRVGEHGLGSRMELQDLPMGGRITAGPFEVEPIRVTHSLPDCASLALRSEAGNVLHTGDWKIDEAPVDGEAFDREALAALGDEGLTLLLSDSTNARSEGWTRGEGEVASALHDAIDGHEGRVIVTQFASNLHRLRGLVDVAQRTGRRIVFSGRSLWRYLQAAAATGRAPIDPGHVVDIAKAGSLDPRECLVITTGSQGEPLSALGQAAIGRHPHLVIGPGDRLIHSARVIPGNEATTYRMFNALSGLGAELVYGRGSGVHGSGHAKRDELREMIALTRPQHFVPVHGERTFLEAHAGLAQEAGVGSVTLAVNGDELHVEKTSIRRATRHELQAIFNDGPATGDAEAMRLRERKRIAWNGVVVVDGTLVRGKSGLSASDIRVRTVGIWTNGDTLAARIVSCVTDEVSTALPALSAEDLEAHLASRVRSLCRRQCGKGPDVMITLHAGPA